MNHLRIRTLVLLLALLPSASVAAAQTVQNFSGTWIQDGAHCNPKRTGEVTLILSQGDPSYTVETIARKDSSAPRRAIQHYSMDGKVSVSIGMDGDEFHTSIVRRGDVLAFTIEEHEDARIILSNETWTLIRGGATLQRVRQRPGNYEIQVWIYRRQRE